MASPRWKSRWRKARNRGTAARTSAPRRLAGKSRNPCIAIGGDRESCRLRWRPSRSRLSNPERWLHTYSKRAIPFRAASRKSIMPREVRGGRGRLEDGDVSESEPVHTPRLALYLLRRAKNPPQRHPKPIPLL